MALVFSAIPLYCSIMMGSSKKEADPRMHSAEHILSATLVKMFGTGRPVTTHLEKKKSKIDIAFERNLSTEEIALIERQVNEVIRADLPVQEEFFPRETAAAHFDLHRLPDDVGGSIRIIRIGTYDRCPCSGTHVRSTADIGAFRIISTDCDGTLLRVRFKLDTPARMTGQPTDAP